MFDENTLVKIQNMDKIVDEVLHNIKTFTGIVDAIDKDSADYEILKQHLLTIIDYQLLPIIEYFN